MPLDECRPLRVGRPTARRARRVLGALGLSVGSVLVVGTLSPPNPAVASAKSSLNVLYAGSLMDLMVHQLAPAFQRASGDTVVGFPGGSLALASEITGGTEVGDVFISASPAVNARLHGPANGNWVSSYVTFGESPLVLGYRQGSRFAAQLRTKPWYTVVGEPGFLLGRTDPATDPKGRLAVTALDEAARRFGRPALLALATSSSNVYPETTLIGRLQSGQLDAGFFYEVEAKSAHLTSAPLAGTALHGTFTVAILRGAPHRAAAKAFVSFLLGSRGRTILTRYGVVALKRPVSVRSFGPARSSHASIS